MARNTRRRPYYQSRWRNVPLLSFFRRRVIEQVLARLRTRHLNAVARQSTHLLATTLAEGGHKLGDGSNVNQSTLPVDEGRENSGSQSLIRRRERKHVGENVEISRQSSNAPKPHHRFAWTSIFSSREDENLVEPAKSRVSKLSKDRKYSQESPHRPRSHKSGSGKSHRLSNPSMSTIRSGKFGYSSDDNGIPHSLDLDLHLPQPADDETISRAVRNLLFFVAQHVGHFYINRDCDVVPPLAMVQLKKLHSPLPDSTVDEIVEDTPYQLTVIEHCLNFLLLSSISMEFPVHDLGTSEGDVSPTYPLLPASFTALLQTIARSSVGPSNLKCYDQALSKLRVLSSYLVPNIANDEVYGRQREEAIALAASAFSQAFSPWENPENEPGARLSNLKVIFNKAADLGIFMLSQPSVFRFDWKPGEVKMKPDEIVVSPKLLKVADENAMTLLQAQEMIKIKLSALRMVVEIDGARENIPAELQGKVLPERVQSKHRRQRALVKSSANHTNHTR